MADQTRWHETDSSVPVTDFRTRPGTVPSASRRLQAQRASNHWHDQRSRPATADSFRPFSGGNCEGCLHLGYGAIPAAHAEPFQKFYTAHFNPYLNFHRPCGFATIHCAANGKRRRVYPANDYRTPDEKLVSLPQWKRFLKPGVTAELLDRLSLAHTDHEAARKMQKAKNTLLAACRLPRGLTGL